MVVNAKILAPTALCSRSLPKLITGGLGELDADRIIGGDV